MFRAVKEGKLGYHGRITSQPVAARVSSGRTIIAMKGIPRTCKSEIGRCIGRWANCPIASIDDFLQAVSMDKGYTFDSPPSEEEAERLRRLALYALYKTAGQHINNYGIVVIKSRLCCLFELDLLIWLAKETMCSNILIVDCKVKYRHHLKERVDEAVSFYNLCNKGVTQRMLYKDLEMQRLRHRPIKLNVQDEWYKARNWKDVDKARNDYFTPNAEADWDDHVLNLLAGYESDAHFTVTRLIVDPFNDLMLEGNGPCSSEVPPDFIHVIALLLSRHLFYQHEDQEEAATKEVTEEVEVTEDEEEEEVTEDDDDDDDKDRVTEEGSEQETRNPMEQEEEGDYLEVDDGIYCDIHSREKQYLVVHFTDLRQTLVKIELSKSGRSKRSRYLCNSTEHQSCVFKYWNNKFDDADADEGNCCGICERRVDPGQPAYACHYCILTLHKSCATLLDLNFVSFGKYAGDSFVDIYNRLKSEYKEACKSCTDQRQHFSDECTSCLFQTHLKLKLLPTIVNHDSHQHPLSILFSNSGLAKYGCYICKFDCKVQDTLLPKQVHDLHGGHAHVVKLAYSLDGMGPELDFWCNLCYKDMSPVVWTYYCQQCPFYVCLKHVHKNVSIDEAISERNLAIRHYQPICKFKTDMLQ